MKFLCKTDIFMEDIEENTRGCFFFIETLCISVAKNF